MNHLRSFLFLLLVLITAGPALAADPPTVQLVNRWNLNGKAVYLVKDSNRKVLDLAPVPTRWRDSQWILEPVGKYVRIKDSFFNHYLHTENGRLELGPMQPNWQSALWELEQVPNEPYFRIRNNWMQGKKDHYLHRENGRLELGPIQAGAWSSQWAKEYVPQAHPNLAQKVKGLGTDVLNSTGDIQYLFLAPTHPMQNKKLTAQHVQGMAMTADGRYVANHSLGSGNGGILIWSKPGLAGQANKDRPTEANAFSSQVFSQYHPSAMQAFGDVIAATDNADSPHDKRKGAVVFFKIGLDNKAYKLDGLQLGQFAEGDGSHKYNGLGFSRAMDGRYYLIGERTPEFGLDSTIEVFELQAPDGTTSSLTGNPNYAATHSLYQDGAKFVKVSSPGSIPTSASNTSLIPKGADEFWVVSLFSRDIDPTFKTENKLAGVEEISVSVLNVRRPTASTVTNVVYAQELGQFRGGAKTLRPSARWAAGIAPVGKELQLFWSHRNLGTAHLELGILDFGAKPRLVNQATAAAIPDQFKLKSSSTQKFLTCPDGIGNNHLIEATGTDANALVFEKIPDASGFKFRVKGTNLYLNYRNLSGAVKLHDSGSDAAFLPSQRPDGSWTLLSVHENQYMWVKGNAPYITKAGAGKNSENGWQFVASTGGNAPATTTSSTPAPAPAPPSIPKFVKIKNASNGGFMRVDEVDEDEYISCEEGPVTLVFETVGTPDRMRFRLKSNKKLWLNYRSLTGATKLYDSDDEAVYSLKRLSNGNYTIFNLHHSQYMYLRKGAPYIRGGESDPSKAIMQWQLVAVP